MEEPTLTKENIAWLTEDGVTSPEEENLPLAAIQQYRLARIGGIEGLTAGLVTHFENGIDGNQSDILMRQNLFGKNEFPVPQSLTWVELFLESFCDQTLIVLIIAAVVSLVVGLYEDIAKGWIEGVAILISVVVVAMVTATNDYSKESQFRKLNAQKDDIDVTVKRGESIADSIQDTALLQYSILTYSILYTNKTN